jgi:hypothetical protein
LHGANVNKTSYDAKTRQLCAAAIEARVMGLALKMGVTITDCSWNLGQGMHHSGTHRLDVGTGEEVDKIYFTDFELFTGLHHPDNPVLEEKLRRLIHRLRDRQLFHEHLDSLSYPYALARHDLK